MSMGTMRITSRDTWETKEVQMNWMKISSQNSIPLRSWTYATTQELFNELERNPEITDWIQKNEVWSIIEDVLNRKNSILARIIYKWNEFNWYVVGSSWKLVTIQCYDLPSTVEPVVNTFTLDDIKWIKLSEHEKWNRTTHSIVNALVKNKSNSQ